MTEGQRTVTAEL